MLAFSVLCFSVLCRRINVIVEKSFHLNGTLKHTFPTELILLYLFSMGHAIFRWIWNAVKQNFHLKFSTYHKKKTFSTRSSDKVECKWHVTWTSKWIETKTQPKKKQVLETRMEIIIQVPTVVWRLVKIIWHPTIYNHIGSRTENWKRKDAGEDRDKAHAC